MKQYLIFGKRATDALWDDENDLDSVIEAMDDLDAELFVYDSEVTPLYQLLDICRKWSDYSFISQEQYGQIMEVA